jgi:hypothetical protein
MDRDEKIELIEKIFVLLDEQEKTSEMFDKLYEMNNKALKVLLILKKHDS